MIKKNNKFAYHQRSVPVRSALLSPAWDRGSRWSHRYDQGQQGEAGEGGGPGYSDQCTHSYCVCECVSVCVWGVVALLECVLTRDPVIITLACAVKVILRENLWGERERGREREGEGGREREGERGGGQVEREHKQPLSKKNACSYITFQTCT